MSLFCSDENDEMYLVTKESSHFFLVGNTIEP